MPTPEPVGQPSVEGVRPNPPIAWPLILTISIALLSVLPVAVCVAALVWAVAGLFGLPTPVIAGADMIAVAAVVVASLPLLVRAFRKERHDAGEARLLRGRPPG